MITVANQPQNKLTKEQKEAVGILSIGTFLEYFDLMLYVHMAVLLNDLFFEPSNPESVAITTAFAFCSSFVFRPVGALIFGSIGDKYGRKPTVLITTTVMAISCVVMATVPTYSDIGIKATVIITLCRITQSISSMGEIVGAKLYVTETIKPPIQYFFVTLIQAFASFGGMVALLLATMVTSYGFNWRYAFWIGAIIAVVGVSARTRLRETPEFSNAKLRIKNIIKQHGYSEQEIDKNPIILEKVKIKNAISLFLMDCTWPVCFYFSYAHCSTILKNVFKLSPEAIIMQNVFVSIADLLGFLVIAFLSYYINPLVILRVKTIMFFILALISPILLNNVSTPFQLFLLQSAIIFFGLSPNPASSLLFKYFPVFKRFTYTSMSFALSRSIMYAVTAFGMVYLTKYFGHYGLFVIMLPTTIGFFYGLKHFEFLESQVVTDHSLSQA